MDRASAYHSEFKPLVPSHEMVTGMKSLGIRCLFISLSDSIIEILSSTSYDTSVSFFMFSVLKLSYEIKQKYFIHTPAFTER